MITKGIPSIHWVRSRFLVGLTGSIGAGKSAVADLFEKEGLPVVRADRLAHESLEDPGIIRRMTELFGDGILDAEGRIFRPGVAKIVFQDPEKRLQLNALIHPDVRRRFHTIVDSLTEGEILIYEVPLLFESGIEAEFDLTITVSAPADLRMKRVQQRSGLTPGEFESRDRTQMPQAEKEQRAGVVIQNDGDLPSLEKTVREIIQTIREARAR